MKIHLFICLLFLQFFLYGCSQSYESIDESFNIVEPNQVTIENISQYKVNGCSNEEKEEINSIIDKSVEAYNEISSIEVITESTTSNSTDYENIDYNATGIATGLLTTDGYIWYPEVVYEANNQDGADNTEEVTVQTYALINGTSAKSYQILSTNEDEGTWLENNRTYTTEFTFSTLVSQLKGLDNKDLSYYETDDFYFIASNYSLYDYYSFEPVQLQYSQDFGKLIAQENEVIPVIFAIDKNSNLLSATFAERVNYSNVDAPVEIDKGNELNKYIKYNSLNQIDIPSEIDLKQG